jgi:phenylacetate-coenzyme A ligase PaaK-like adenylate-forming protein
MKMLNNMTSKDEVRNYFLELTLKHAVSNSNYYRDKIGDFYSEVKTLSDLYKIPILHKTVYRHLQEQFMCIKDFPDYLFYTSGTTGNRLIIPVLKSELNVYSKILLKNNNKHIQLPLTLAILPAGSGAKASIRESPTIPTYIDITKDDPDNGIEYALQLLKGIYHYEGVDSRITIIVGQLSSIRDFTVGLLEKGHDPSELGIKKIISGGSFISERLRNFLENTWTSRIVDRYGLTEIHGHANSCKICKWYHFGISVIPEVVNPNTLVNITNGVGILVLTGLYPFNQAEAKIRYFTEDIVEIKTNQCRIDTCSFKFKGRMKYTIFWTDNKKETHYLLFPTDISQILDDFPDISRREGGLIPKFWIRSNLEKTPFMITLCVELLYRPELFPKRVRDLQVQIYDRLNESNKTFEHFISQGMIYFDIEFFGPEKLQNFFIV